LALNPSGGEVGELQLQAAEDLVERVVAADRDGDELERRGARRLNRSRQRGRRQRIEGGVEQRVLYLGPDRREDRARDCAGGNDAQAARLRDSDGLGSGLCEERSGHRR
jgi:hypothetical protein